MINSNFHTVSTIALFAALFFIESCAKIEFKSSISEKNVIRVDEEINFTLTFKNNGLSKKYVNYPSYGVSLFFYIKESNDSVWHEIIHSRTSDSNYLVFIRPKRPAIFETSSSPNMMLLPNKKYVLKSVYYPHEAHDNCYDPNKKSKCPKSLFKESDLIFMTSSLSENGLEEWNWLEKHGLMNYYVTSDYKLINKEASIIAEDFISKFPESIFSSKAKILYIRHIIFMTEDKALTKENILKAIEYCHEIKSVDPKSIEFYLQYLLKKMEEIKK